MLQVLGTMSVPRRLAEFKHINKRRLKGKNLDFLVVANEGETNVLTCQSDCLQFDVWEREELVVRGFSISLKQGLASGDRPV